MQTVAPCKRTAVSTHRGKLSTESVVPDTDERIVHVTMVLTFLGMKRKSKAPCHGMANPLVNIRGDALGFADTSGGALSEMSSESSNHHAT